MGVCFHYHGTFQCPDLAKIQIWVICMSLSNELMLPVRNMQTVFPALHQSANDLQIVAENCPLGMEAVLHQEL